MDIDAARAPTMEMRRYGAASTSEELESEDFWEQGPPRPPNQRRFKALRQDLAGAYHGGYPYTLVGPPDEAAAVARTRAFIELNALLDFASDMHTFDVEREVEVPYTEQELAELFFAYAQGECIGGLPIEEEHLASIMTCLDPGNQYLFEP